MRYKATNLMDIGEGKYKKFVIVYKTFEELIRKVNRDLQSIWNGIVPFPYNLKIEAVNDDTPLGLKLYNEHDELLAENEKDVAEALEFVAEHPDVSLDNFDEVIRDLGDIK